MSNQDGAKMLPSRKRWVDLAISFALMVGIGFLPPIGVITQYGMQVLGILIGVLYAWVRGEITWSAVMALLVLGMCGENTVSGVLVGAVGNANVVQCVCALLFCYVIEQTGLLSAITNWILSRKFARKSLWSFVMALLVASVVGAAVLGTGFVVVMLVWSILWEACEQMCIKPFSKFAALAMIAVAICADFGSVIMPYNGWLIICQGMFASVSGQGFNMGAYALLMIVLNVVLLFAVWGVFKFLCRKEDYSQICIPQKSYQFTKRDKRMLLYVIIAIFILLAPNIVPKGTLVGQFIAKFGTYGVFALVPIMFMMLTYEGENLFDITKGFKEGVPWDMVFIIACALSLGSAIVSEKTGISAQLGALISQMLAGQPVVVMTIILVVLVVVLTNCINNMVVMTIMMTIGVATISAMGGHAELFAMLCVPLVLQAIVLPSGSVVGAMLHGSTDWVKPAMIYKYAIIGEAIVIVVACAVGVPLGTLLLG